MRYVAIIIVVAILMCIQNPILSLFNMETWGIDAGLVAVLYLAATSHALGGFVASWITGFVVDSFTLGGILGMHMELLALMFLLSRGLVARFNLLRPLPLMLVTIICSVTKTLLYFLFSVVFDRDFSNYDSIFLWALPHAAVAALFAPLLFALFWAIDRRLLGHRDTDRQGLFRWAGAEKGRI